ncbi:transposase [Dactylosporangium roseum]|uniref:Transposase n=1 Tax=Dactylosporangium roseum TaxID=47989 RepID=A0ABY5ZEE1_9ACTN|nr:transposase [Dactylosporangium roseum]
MWRRFCPAPRSPSPRPRPRGHRLRPIPSRVFAINAAWLELARTAIDLLARTRTLLLDGGPTAAEPKKLRYRLLDAAARITHTARRTRLRIP